MSTGELKWTLDKIKDFIDVLMELTLCTNVQELKDHTILESVWSKVEKKLDINEESLKYIWYYHLHLQLFCPEPIYMNDIIIKLINYFHKEEVTDAKNINWNKVAKYFDGVTIKFLKKIFYNLMKLVKNKTKIKNFREMIAYLHDTHIPNVMSSDNDKMLPRLKYSEGSLTYIDTNIQDQEYRNISMDNDE